MKIFFTGQAPRLPETDPQRPGTAGLPEVPAHVLGRHGARVLNPGEAPLAAQSPRPGSTIYRYHRLMAESRLLDNDSQLSDLDSVLCGHGVRMNREHLRHRDRTRRVHLAPSGATPGAVDAWRVLETLRGSVDSGQCAQEVHDRLRLEHVMVGSALLVGTEKGGGPGTGGSPEEARSAQFTYPHRIPVDLPLPMPGRRPLSAIPGGRRPVVAVLDTGVPQVHPAFGTVTDRQENADSFLTVDHALQDALRAEADPDAPLIDGPWDERSTDESLWGDVTSHYGHGTFISGLIRQIAPDAEVRAIRVMYNDGIVYEQECLGALTALAEEAERARAGDETARPVDVVCLSFGYVDENPEDQVHGALREAILRLTGLGIPLVSAAGNLSSTRPFYPAAFTTEPQPPEAAPVISVGALNPNASVAMFSNDGPWVTAFATGASLISAFPTMAAGSSNPAVTSVEGGRHRESLDPDDFSSGFAMWSGTSFAAPLVAGRIAAALVDNAEIAELGAQDNLAVTHRVQSALKAVNG